MQRISSKNHQEQIEDLLESNESFRIQTEALKDAFQTEVKKLNQEASEVKKLNKDLKDSLLKISTKYENQNKFINEIAQLIQFGGNDNLTTIRNYIQTQQAFMSEIFDCFKEKNTENLLSTIIELKKEKDSGNSMLKKLSQVVYDLEKYTGEQAFQILGYLKNKEAKYKIFIEEIKQNFEKNMRNMLAAFNALIDGNLDRIKKCFSRVLQYKSNNGKNMDENLMDIYEKNNLLEEMTDHVCELEDKLQQSKFNQIELNDIITKQAKEIINSTEESNKLKIYHDSCLQLFEEYKDIDCQYSECNEFKKKVENILQSKIKSSRN